MCVSDLDDRGVPALLELQLVEESLLSPLIDDGRLVEVGSRHRRQVSGDVLTDLRRASLVRRKP
jgi:hypothetical protein